MNLSTKVELFKSGSDGYDPRREDDGFVSPVSVGTRWVNVTTVPADVAYRDYGLSDARLVRLRSLSPLPQFDKARIVGTDYAVLSSQSIGDRRSFLLKEVEPHEI